MKFLLGTLSWIADASAFRQFYTDLQSDHDWLVKIRREIHRYPEIGFETQLTSQIVKRELKALGIDWDPQPWCRSPVTNSTYGVVANIRGDLEGPIILLRADMDGLAMQEMANVPFASNIEGRMHACGHDGHTTMLLGAAKLLQNVRASLKGTVRLMFQPAEELHGGGKVMVDEGVLRGVKSAFALHVFPGLATGVIGMTSGLALAGGTHFYIEIQGVGGHAGLPFLSKDPVVAAAALTIELQNLASRETFGRSPEHAGLVSVTQIFTEGNTNVIPSKAKVSGTLRSFSSETVEYMKERVIEMARGLRLSHRVEATVEFGVTFPAMMNSEKLVHANRDLVKEASLTDPVKLTASYAMEDFAYVANNVESVMYFIGVGSGEELNEHVPTNYSLHHPMFALDERVLSRGGALLASLAIEQLNDVTQAHSEEL